MPRVDDKVSAETLQRELGVEELSALQGPAAAS
jgi:hypothetical protein